MKTIWLGERIGVWGLEWLGLNEEKIPKKVQTDFPIGYSQSREKNDVTSARHAEGSGQA